MAEGLLRHDAGGRFAVESAGTHPSKLRPEAVQVMHEIEIDISAQHAKAVGEFAGRQFDYVLTVCDQARESCPFYPGHRKLFHHSFEDPAAVQGSFEERLDAFRRVRDQIRAYLVEFASGNW